MVTWSLLGLQWGQRDRLRTADEHGSLSFLLLCTQLAEGTQEWLTKGWSVQTG